MRGGFLDCADVGLVVSLMFSLFGMCAAASTCPPRVCTRHAVVGECLVSRGGRPDLR